jgi:hypothetical protein
MALNPDFRDLFAAFNAARVRYLLVGGYALAFHGRPRFTKDLDVWLDPESENAQRAYAALETFGAPLHELRISDLERPGLIFQIGVAPNRIDVLTSIDGVTFAEGWSDRQETQYSDQKVPVIGLRHLIKNKRATGRPQDLLDADELEKA